jgi:acyl carrier protein
MNKEKLHTRLETVFGKIFIDIPIKKIQTLNKLNAERWDSLSHLNLIISLEEEFKISIAYDEVDSITSFGSAMAFLENKN